jgi:uncharacterized protein
MHQERHALPSIGSGTTRELVSLRYGAGKSGKKVYIQASLHADEVPAMLVAHHLRGKLAESEARGEIDGEIVLLPIANPIGLAQTVLGHPFGRFDLTTGINFNRGYTNLVPELKQALAGKLGADAAANTGLIRAEAVRLLSTTAPRLEADALKQLLQRLAIDADIVLDLHCDHEGVAHVYAGTHMEAAVAPLASLLGAGALLLAHDSGDEPFDESCGRHWPELAAHFGPATPVPHACLSVTIELRGERDVTHALAEKDAQAIVDFLAHAGHVGRAPPALPPMACTATPLQGVERVKAPHPGVLAWRCAPGTVVRAGEHLADLVEPLGGTVTPLAATIDGTFFARAARRYAYGGMEVARIAGAKPLRSGKLLGL